MKDDEFTLPEEDRGPISDTVAKFTDNIIKLAEDQNTDAYKQNITLFSRWSIYCW